MERRGRQPAQGPLGSGAGVLGGGGELPRGTRHRVQNPALHPFACKHSPDLPELLWALGCSLAISTYQAGKVMLVSSDGERLQLLPRAFDTPMGMATDGERLAIALKHEVVLLAADRRLASTYPPKPDIYDTMYLPRQVYFTGPCHMHDLAWTADGLVGVNTRFSCLCRLDGTFSFVPTWRPPFISALAPEDRCHLNGLAVDRGKVRYVTALGTADSAGGWRPDKLRGGVVMEPSQDATVLAGLAMPHSPRLYDGELYLLLSATGELVHVDPQRGRYEVIQKLPGFVRGMARAGDHLFVGLSRLRQTHTFGDLELARRKDLLCGVAVVHLPTGAYVGYLQFLATCEEIYDICVLPGLRRPGILGPASEAHRLALALPDKSFWQQPAEPKTPTEAAPGPPVGGQVGGERLR